MLLAVQGARSDELLLATYSAAAPAVLLEVVQQRKLPFELFQIFGAQGFFCSESQGKQSYRRIPGKDGGSVKFFFFSRRRYKLTF
jgi:hypothetical protein